MNLLKACLLILSFGSMLVAPLFSCSGPMVKNPHTIEKLNSSPLRFRRPQGKGANPIAGPGGLDFYSHPKPDPQLDCREPKELFRKIRLSEVRACLDTLVKGPQYVRYRLERGDVPELVFEHEEEEELPKLRCLQRALPKIPVPREIFFFSYKESNPECFSARLGDERIAVMLSLPIPGTLKTDEDLIRYLTAWSMTPLFSPETRTIPEARLVPEHICKTCFNDKNIYKRSEEEMLSPPWP